MYKNRYTCVMYNDMKCRGFSGFWKGCGQMHESKDVTAYIPSCSVEQREHNVAGDPDRKMVAC